MSFDNAKLISNLSTECSIRVQITTYHCPHVTAFREALLREATAIALTAVT